MIRTSSTTELHCKVKFLTGRRAYVLQLGLKLGACRRAVFVKNGLFVLVECYSSFAAQLRLELEHNVQQFGELGFSMRARRGRR